MASSNRAVADVLRRSFTLVLAMALLGVLVALPVVLPRWLREARWERVHGPVIHEAVSDYSRIRVREQGSVRSLHFVDADGWEQLQSAVDLEAPGKLQVRYTRTLFASLLLRHPQERILIVGLGGGGMVRFAQETLPDTQVEAVEIDPVIVEIAATWFGTRETGRTRIHTEDAFVFLTEPQGPYDAIYLDAFLRPPAESDLGTMNRRLKTESFLREIRGRLVPGGLAAFNLMEHDPATGSDRAAIEAVFPAVYEFAVPGTGNLVVLASTQHERVRRAELARRAENLERELAATGLPFRSWVEALRE